MNFFLTPAKVILSLSFSILLMGYTQAQMIVFDELKAEGNNKPVSWFTSVYGAGFGHKIYGIDPQLDGITQLRFAGRQNSATWVDAMTIHSDGKIGIGSGAFRPISLLEVRGTISDPSTSSTSNGIFTLGNTTTEVVNTFGISNTASPYSWIQTRSKTANINYPLVLNPRGGNVGIGTLIPSNNLHIKSVVTGSNGGITIESADAKKWDLTAVASTGNFVISQPSTGLQRLVISEAGNVGIGTATTNTCKLAVAGTIGANEIKIVALGAPFPDYVFESDYKLRTLTELGNYVAKHKHLPGIVTAEEVKTNGGVELGSLQLKMLEKIEEMTIYILEQNKRIEALEKSLANSKN